MHIPFKFPPGRRFLLSKCCNKCLILSYCRPRPPRRLHLRRRRLGGLLPPGHGRAVRGGDQLVGDCAGAHAHGRHLARRGGALGGALRVRGGHPGGRGRDRRGQEVRRGQGRVGGRGAHAHTQVRRGLYTNYICILVATYSILPLVTAVSLQSNISHLIHFP